MPFILILVFLLGCGQKADSLKGSSSGRDCEANFSQDIFEHGNIQEAFRCTGWDQEYPALYDGIKSAKPETWNYFFSKFNQKFINIKKNRNFFFGKIKRLDEENALDSFAKYLESIFKFKNFEFYCQVLAGLKNDLENCEGASVKNLSHINAYTIMKLANLSQTEKRVLSDFINSLVLYSEKNNDFFSLTLTKLLDLPAFSQRLIKMIDKLVDENFFIDELREFMPLQSLKKGLPKKKQSFVSLFAYTQLVDPGLKGVVLDLDQNIRERVSCDENSRLSWSMGSEIDFVANKFFHSSRIGLQRSLEKRLLEFSFLRFSCPSIKDSNFLPNSLYSAMLFSQEPFRFEMFQSFHKTNHKTPREKIKSLKNFLLSGFYYEFDLFNWMLISESINFYENFYDYLGQTEAHKIAKYERTFFSYLERNQSSLHELSLLWEELSLNQKQILIKLVTDLFKNGEDSQKGLNLLGESLFFFKDDLSDYYRSYFSTQAKTAKTLSLLKELGQNFLSSEAVKEFRSFFSRDQIVETVRLIGVNIKDQRSVSFTMPEKPMGKTRGKRRPTVEAENRCFFDSFLSVGNLYELIKNFPSSCIDSKRTTPVKLGALLHEIQKKRVFKGDFEGDLERKLFQTIGQDLFKLSRLSLDMENKLGDNFLFDILALLIEPYAHEKDLLQYFTDIILVTKEFGNKIDFKVWESLLGNIFKDGQILSSRSFEGLSSFLENFTSNVSSSQPKQELANLSGSNWSSTLVNSSFVKDLISWSFSFNKRKREVSKTFFKEVNSLRVNLHKNVPDQKAGLGDVTEGVFAFGKLWNSLKRSYFDKGEEIEFVSSLNNILMKLNSYSRLEDQSREKSFFFIYLVLKKANQVFGKEEFNQEILPILTKVIVLQKEGVNDFVRESKKVGKFIQEKDLLTKISQLTNFYRSSVVYPFESWKFMISLGKEFHLKMLRLFFELTRPVPDGSYWRRVLVDFKVNGETKEYLRRTGQSFVLEKAPLPQPIPLL